MKKSYIALFCLSATLLLTGCGTNPESQAMKSLESQLNRVQTIVSSTSTNEVIDVSPNISFDANSTYSSLQSFKATSYQNMQREEVLRQDILSMSAHLKSCTQTKYNLSKTKSNSIIDLSNNISKYAESLDKTKTNVKNNVSQIQKHLNSSKKLNLDQAQSSYISLNNNMNERYAYMSNIYSSLEQIYNILGCCDNCTDTNCLDCETTPTQDNSTTNQNNETKQIKNIDTFVNNQENTQTALQTPPINTQNPANGVPYDYNNSYYGRDYYAQDRFNPNRNTDTFYARNRNIDTYRFNPNYYYNMYYNNGRYRD